ncbi:hypothetical protein C3B59_01230 [Cryobacterium zongtaii]|uniref:Uncharacterized protein n=1 Tax=Cryobacterium zongtaii TaxID=1259217 RepID=A0A2S3ZPV6_9MICO|nr:hypothetical protein C3B59_01230 [Cryobacterium zongtaii]
MTPSSPRHASSSRWWGHTTDICGHVLRSQPADRRGLGSTTSAARRPAGYGPRRQGPIRPARSAHIYAVAASRR